MVVISSPAPIQLQHAESKSNINQMPLNEVKELSNYDELQTVEFSSLI